jgi:hypothetical protein
MLDKIKMVIPANSHRNSTMQFADTRYEDIKAANIFKLHESFDLSNLNENKSQIESEIIENPSTMTITSISESFDDDSNLRLKKNDGAYKALRQYGSLVKGRGYGNQYSGDDSKIIKQELGKTFTFPELKGAFAGNPPTFAGKVKTVKMGDDEDSELEVQQKPTLSGFERAKAKALAKAAKKGIKLEDVTVSLFKSGNAYRYELVLENDILSEGVGMTLSAVATMAYREGCLFEAEIEKLVGQTDRIKKIITNLVK